MKLLRSTRGWIALCVVLGSAAAAAAEPPVEEAVTLPNAADPKPDTAGSQGAMQIVVVSLEKRAEGASNSQPQEQKTVESPGKRYEKPAPFHRPKSN